MIKVEIEEALYNQYFNNETFEKSKLERCGILVGKQISHEFYRITEIIEDREPISQSEFGVYRSTDHIYPQLISSKSKKPEIDYLGEWHTHPNGPNCASFVDILTMKSMISNPLYGIIHWAFLLIVISNKLYKMYLINNEGIVPSKIIFI